MAKTFTAILSFNYNVTDNIKAWVMKNLEKSEKINEMTLKLC